MKNEWIGPKIIIGNKATGEYYYPRTVIEDEIIEELYKSNNILIAAPRRVGKTSVVVNLASNCPPEMKCIFENVQGINTENGFYKRFYELILSALNKDKQIWNKFSNFVNEIHLTEISTSGGIKFNDKKQLNYLQEIDKIAEQLNKEEIKVVLFIDELPEVLHNLYKKNKIEEAKMLLENLRRWRQKQFKYINIVLTGSIGIHHVVKRIEGRVTDLNDIKSITYEPFTKSQAKEYIEHVTRDATIKYSDVLNKYLVNKISYRIPYFINLLLDEVNKEGKRCNNSNVEKIDIDNAFNKVVKESTHFSDWKDRLFEYFTENQAVFMNEVLKLIAHKDKITKKELYNLAHNHKMTINYMDLINDLDRDGYILEEDNYYTFVSPFLKAFWKRNQPIFD